MSICVRILMRPLDDIGFTCYWLSACSHIFGGRYKDWVTAIRPKKSAEYWHWGLGSEVKQKLFYPEGREPNEVKTIRLVQIKPDGSKERREVGIANLFVQIVPNPFGVPLKGFAVHYYDGDMTNTALPNLWYGAARRSAQLKLAWDGKETYRRLKTDPIYREHLKFKWRLVMPPLQD